MKDTSVFHFVGKYLLNINWRMAGVSLETGLFHTSVSLLFDEHLLIIYILVFYDDDDDDEIKIKLN